MSTSELFQYLTPTTLAAVYSDLSEHPEMQENGMLDAVCDAADMPVDEFKALVERVEGVSR